MTDRIDISIARYQQRRVVLPVVGARQGVEHRLAEGAMTAGFARATWPESAPMC